MEPLPRMKPLPMMALLSIQEPALVAGASANSRSRCQGWSRFSVWSPCQLYEMTLILKQLLRMEPLSLL